MKKENFSFKKFIGENKYVFLSLSLLVIICYANALFNNFVSDDRGTLMNANNFGLVLAYPVIILRAFMNYGIYQIGGFNAILYRLPNIFFHLGSVYLIFLLGTLLKNRFTGFVAASLFAVHPVLIESVTWISGGVYAQYSFFFLLSFLFYIQKKRVFFTLAIISFILALFSSEKAVVLSLIYFVYELAFGSIRKNWKKWTPFLAVSGVYTLFYLGNIGKRVEDLQEGGSFTPGMDNPLIQIPFAITNYLDLIFWPNALTLYNSELAISQVEFIIRLVLFLVLLGFFAYSFKKQKHLFFWMVFFIIPLLPTLTPFRITWIVAERYVYLGTIGIFVLVALGFAKLHEKKIFTQYSIQSYQSLFLLFQFVQ